MVRAVVYLGGAGLVWMAEGFIFSQFLGFSAWQIAVMVIMYVGLFSLAVVALLHQRRRYLVREGSLPPWRWLSLAPMLTMTVGSFVSLPLLLFILAIGKSF
jgi:hypothetical protein